MNDWRVFYGNRDPHNEISRLPNAPSWRRFKRKQKLDEKELRDRWHKILNLVERDSREYERGKSFRILSPPQDDNKVVQDPKKAKIYL